MIILISLILVSKQWLEGKPYSCKCVLFRMETLLHILILAKYVSNWKIQTKCPTLIRLSIQMISLHVKPSLTYTYMLIAEYEWLSDPESFLSSVKKRHSKLVIGSYGASEAKLIFHYLQYQRAQPHDCFSEERKKYHVQIYKKHLKYCSDLFSYMTKYQVIWFFNQY